MPPPLATAPELEAESSSTPGPPPLPPGGHEGAPAAVPSLPRLPLLLSDRDRPSPAAERRSPDAAPDRQPRTAPPSVARCRGGSRPGGCNMTLAAGRTDGGPGAAAAGTHTAAAPATAAPPLAASAESEKLAPRFAAVRFVAAQLPTPLLPRDKPAWMGSSQKTPRVGASGSGGSCSTLRSDAFAHPTCAASRRCELSGRPTALDLMLPERSEGLGFRF